MNAFPSESLNDRQIDRLCSRIIGCMLIIELRTDQNPTMPAELPRHYLGTIGDIHPRLRSKGERNVFSVQLNTLVGGSQYLNHSAPTSWRAYAADEPIVGSLWAEDDRFFDLRLTSVVGAQKHVSQCVVAEGRARVHYWAKFQKEVLEHNATVLPCPW